MYLSPSAKRDFAANEKKKEGGGGVILVTHSYSSCSDSLQSLVISFVTSHNDVQ